MQRLSCVTTSCWFCSCIFLLFSVLSLECVLYTYSLLHLKYYIAHARYLALSHRSISRTGIAAPICSPNLMPTDEGLRVLRKRVGEVGMIWPAGVSLWAQRPLHRSIMHTLMAVKWLARNEKLPSSVRVMVSLGPLSPFKGNTLRSVGFLCVPAHVNYRQWQTISCFIRKSPWSYIILTRVVVPGEH